MADIKDLSSAINELSRAQEVIATVRANDALAAQITTLAQLLRKNLVADNCNCNCGAARFDPLSDVAQRG